MRCLLILAVLTRIASADDDPPATATMVDKVVELTNNFFDQHVDLLTHDMLQLRVDPEQRGAKIAVGGGFTRVLKVRVASNVEVVDGTARIRSRVALAVVGKQLNVRLPSIDVAPATFPHRFSGDRDDRFERGVEVRLPLLRRAF